MPFPFLAESNHPPLLAAAEMAEIAARRRQHQGISSDAPLVGVALSGGGIRSATFCLGLFQALARQKAIRRIDLLSTVSGGGYFGAFLGTAFTRPGASADKVEDELANNHSWSVEWLRENGRFLSPNGSGDNWVTAAVALRNWFTLQLVLLTFSFFFLGLGNLIRADLATEVFTQDWWGKIELFFWEHPAGNLWLSPWTVLPVIPFVLILVPTGLFYWSTQFGVIMASARAITAVFCRSCRGITHAEFASRAQSTLTHGFAMGFTAMVGLAIFALMDSVGQTVYLRWSIDFAFPSLWTMLTGAGFGLFAFAAKLVVYLEPLLGRKGTRITSDVIALGAALIWLFLILLSLSVIAAGFAWQWRSVFNEFGGFARMSGGWPLMVAVGICFIVSWIFSRAFGFVNLSSMQQMYAARLSRAYLGATNPERRAHANHSMTDLIPGDELPLDEYCPHRQGGPLHLINVTVNETVSGKTQIGRRDRKGFAMAIGPCGLSVGATTHSLWAPARTETPRSNLHALWEERKRAIIPIPSDKESTYHPFAAEISADVSSQASADGGMPRIEALSLGRWVSISGAAFTTGIGSRTQFGLSLLLGLANVRLGYWWDSGTHPGQRRRGAKPNLMEVASSLISRVLPVQTCLVSECFARFHGANRRHWYLSDGGHFENTGCYELIRRRVPLIICSDGGQDPRFQFDDLANLVRKARIDFGAEIQIVQRAGADVTADPDIKFPMPRLEEIVHPELLDVIGTPEDFEPPAKNADDEGEPAPVRSQRYALLARVHYLDTNTFSWLLIIKPTLTGSEAMDVLQYQRTHPLFPQEPTSDQYFDEAQWESYRKLGEHIGTELFTSVAKPGPGWSPALFTPPTVPDRRSGVTAEG